MTQARFAEVVGRENICENVLEALARARALQERDTVVLRL